MTPLDPTAGSLSPDELQTRLTNARLSANDWHACQTQEELADWRNAQQSLIEAAFAVARSEQSAELARLTEAHQEAQNEIREDELQWDAFTEGQAAALKGKPRESNPYPPGDSFNVPVEYQLWDDGYDCCINRALKAEVSRLTDALAEARQETAVQSARITQLVDQLEERTMQMKQDALREALTSGQVSWLPSVGNARTETKLDVPHLRAIARPEAAPPICLCERNSTNDPRCPQHGKRPPCSASADGQHHSPQGRRGWCDDCGHEFNEPGSPSPVPSPAAWIADVIREVAELPDRTSPDDWPEAMLVTSQELEAILVAALRRLPPPTGAQ